MQNGGASNSEWFVNKYQVINSISIPLEGMAGND